MYEVCLVITNSMLIFKSHIESWKIKFLFPWKMQYLEERSNSSFRINFQSWIRIFSFSTLQVVGVFMWRISYMGY